MKNNKDSKNKKLAKDLLPMILAELCVAGVTVIAAWLLSLAGVLPELLTFDYRIFTGALLGVTVIIANYAFLIISVDKAVSNFIALRGEKEMSDEEAERFAAENAMPVQNAIKTSFIVRTVSMLAALVVAFLLDLFNPIATAAPLLAFRPLLSVIEGIKARKLPPPNPDRFVKYDDDTTEEEKESDE